MRLSSAIVIGAFALAACGEREAAPSPEETVAAEAPVSDAVQTAPRVLNAADLRRVCRAGLAASGCFGGRTGPSPSTSPR